MNKRLTGWLRFIPLIFAVLLASSCGGGENAADKDVSSASSDGNKRQTLSVGSVPATEKRLSVASISLVNSIRISRTVFQYAYAVTVSNSGSEVAEAAVQLKSVGDGTTIVNGSFKTGPIRAGGSSSVGTITVQQDRTFLFSVDRWSWAMDVFDPPTTVGIDPSVPTASRSAVTKLISPEGSAAPGSPTPISLSNPNHESLILGVNSKGEILLASIATGRQTSLSTSSTAQALVRVAFGSVPEALTAAGLNSIIKNTASFSKLVESIQQVLLNATPPMSSEQVVIQIGNVLSETAQALPDSKALAQNRSNTKTKLSTVALPTVDAKGLPYSIVPDTLSSFLPVAVEDTCGNMLLNKCVNGGSTDKTAIAIANPMPIPWVARSTSLDGAVLTGPLKMPALKVDSALSFLRRLTVPWSLTDTTGYASNGSAVNITIEQTSETRKDILTEIVWGAISSAFDFSYDPITQICSSDVIKSSILSVLNASAITGDLSAPPSIAQVLSAGLDQFTEAATLTTLVRACGGNPRNGPALATFVGTSSQVLKQLASKLDTIGKGYKASSLLVKTAYAVEFWDVAPSTVGVCLSSDGNIQNCVKTLEFTPSELYVTPAVKFSTLTTLKARDKDGNTTPYPSNLSYFSIHDTVLINLNSVTGEATATELGNAAVTVTDPATKTSGSYIVHIGNPIISPNSAKVNVGSDILLTLTFDGTNPITPAPNSIWESSNSAVGRLNLLKSLLVKCPSGPLSCIVLDGLASGETTVTFTNGVTGAKSTRIVEITASTQSEIVLTSRTCKETVMPCANGTTQCIVDQFDYSVSAANADIGSSISIISSNDLSLPNSTKWTADCGAWTLRAPPLNPGNIIQCKREVGQPSSTTVAMMIKNRWTGGGVGEIASTLNALNYGVSNINLWNSGWFFDQSSPYRSHCGLTRTICPGCAF